MFVTVCLYPRNVLVSLLVRYQREVRMGITARQADAAKPGGKIVKMSDGGGLQLWVMPTGAKLWRFAYRHGGKQKLMAFGSYPQVTIKEARERLVAERKLLSTGVDPSVVRKVSRANTFHAVADEWLQKQRRDGRAEVTVHKNRWVLSFALPAIGARPIREILRRNTVCPAGT